MREAAAKAGVGYATMHGLVKGKRGNPSIVTLEKISSAYGVSVQWLLDDPTVDLSGRYSQDAQAAVAMMEHFEGVVRRMGGADVDPDELVLRKLDVIEGLKRLYGAAGGVPDWVYDMERRIKRGEL